MIRPLTVAAVVLLPLLSTPMLVSARELEETPIERALQQAAEGRTIFSEFLLGAASMREITAQQELLARINEWISASLSLTPAGELPAIKYAAPSTIAALRFKGLAVLSSVEVTGSIARTAIEQTTVAIYVDAEKAIYLPENWTGSSPAELSVLVHEMVHHLQNAGGVRHECPREREKLAYAAQQKFLELFGRDLSADFELDAFTIFVRSTCAY